MSWRSGATGFTGSNNIPLGNRRRFRDDGAPGDDGGYNPSQPSAGMPMGEKRGRSPEPRSTTATGASIDAAVQGAKRRKKKSRWGPAEENKAAGLVGLPTLVTGPMTAEQLDAYAIHYRIQEITKKLQINDILPPEEDRSPSPPPIYDNFGRRVNTTEYRYRKKYEDERHQLVQQAFKTIPNYQPPPDYRRPTKTQEKVYVPVNDYPEINFIGLLIGPRGNTLKKMEAESGAKIAIRGKGSVKEGKGRSDAAHTSNQEEDLHCLIMADSEDKVNKAKSLIHNIIETAASIPEGQNELKRNQLRELAALNGTLRDDENQACQNCGQIGHRKYDCPEQRNFTANIICRVCGNAGHMARDCPERQRGSDWRNNGPPRAAGRVPDQDKEYEALMNDLAGQPAGHIQAAPGTEPQGGDFKPWRQGGGSGGTAPWQRGREERSGGGGGGSAPPWAGGRSGGDNYGYGRDQSGYGAPPAAPWSSQPSSTAPWQQSGNGPPPPPPGDGNSNPWSSYGGYNQVPGYGAPPPPMGAPGGLGSMFPNMPPPPPPPDSEAPPPPPPPSEQPPPPPPPGA